MTITAFTQKDREHFLIGMMKVGYLKRLESSIESFEISMDRTIRKIENLEKKINNFLTSKLQTQEQSLEYIEPDEDELEENAEDVEQWQVGKKFKYDLADLELERWLKDLKNDKEPLVDLYNNAISVTPERDAKLAELKKIIGDKVKNPFNAQNKKVIVFTAFADTASYLYDNIQPWCQSELKLNCALICGSYTKTTYGKGDYDSILLNFSPVAKNRAKMTGIS